MKHFELLLLCSLFTISGLCCKDNKTTAHQDGLPTASFVFHVYNQGQLPDTVRFRSTSTQASTLQWDFGNGHTATSDSPLVVFERSGNYQVTLRASNKEGADSITKGIAILIEKPAAGFSFTASDPEVLPAELTFHNTSKDAGLGATYRWSFSNGDTSTEQEPVVSFTAGGIYEVKLVVTNAAGSDSLVQQVRISPYPQRYTNFNGNVLELFAWKGKHVMLLSQQNDLDRKTMYKWLNAMDTAYGFYKRCTGALPIEQQQTFLDSLSTIAEVPQTCGAGCGYLGATGIEIQTDYFDVMYNAISNEDQYDQVLFYELGRNFWLYGSQLAYQDFGPFTTGYAVFMRFLAMEAAGLKGAPFGAYSFPEFKKAVTDLVDLYLADPSLNWDNTLGAAQGVPGAFGSNNDLFASFCLRLRRDYGGNAFVEKLWKQAGLRPAAQSEQDVIDNFFLAACAAAGQDLTALFESWRWPLSDGAREEALQYH